MNAQEFPQAWKSSFSSSPSKLTDFSADGSLVLGASETSAQMLDGNTGASKWDIKFKDKFGVKTFDKVRWNDASGVVVLFNADSKKEKGLQVFIDDQTGNELWRSSDYGGTDAQSYYNALHGLLDNYFESVKGFAVLNNTKSQLDMVEAKSGKALWSVPVTGNVSVGKAEGYNLCFTDDGNEVKYYDAETGKPVASVDFSKYALKSDRKTLYGGMAVSEEQDRMATMTYQKRLVAGATGSKRKITVTCKKLSDASTQWATTFEGIVVTTLTTEEDLVSIDIVGDKVFAMYEGITVLDLATGKILWSADFDNSDVSVGLKAKQEIGISAMPFVDGNAVYVVDLKKDNDIKKYDAATGKILWESPKMGKDPVVPNIVVADGVLIAQLGGRINVQTYIPGSNGNPDVYKSEYKFVGPYGLIAYGTDNGQVLWQTDKMKDVLKDKFSDRITDVQVADGKAFVCSDKNLFCLDPKTGQPSFTTPLGDLKIGGPLQLTLDKKGGRIYVICDKGIAAFGMSDGKNIYATKVGDILSDFSVGDNYFVWIGEDEFAGFDLATGKVKGTFKGQTHPRLTPDGNYLFNFDGSKVQKYKINP
ncbi:MAG TPA: PQQ-binding-like beta-propeller repeat protein [Bacteroidia bacterium]|nr:PQQ-binding-like beta-propeller repeat protein [Bacteroidia bacterium]